MINHNKLHSQTGKIGRVIGIGTDIVEIDRLNLALRRTTRFASFVFSKEEMAYCNSKARPQQHYAARFAAKEAFLKAVGRGIFDGIPLSEIEVIRIADSPPQFRLGPRATQALHELGAAQALVSLSHAGNQAIAFVLVHQ